MNAATNLDSLNAAQLTAYVSSAPNNRAEFFRSVDAQNTKLAKRSRRNFDKLVKALDMRLGASNRRDKSTRKIETMVWECVYDASELCVLGMPVALVIVTFDVPAGCVRVMLRAVGVPDKISTIDRGLTFDQIAKCADAILNG